MVRSEDLINPEPHDIAVMCPNLLWPTQDSVALDDPEDVIAADMVDPEMVWGVAVHQVIADYPLIVFDEMHYAHKNIVAFQKAASKSLVFGFTASPISSNGDLLEQSVRMSVYDYNAANINDDSMKYIGEVSANGDRISADTIDDWKTTNGWLGGAPTEGLNAELIRMRTVINSTIKRVYELDNDRQEPILAPHRNPDKFTVGDPYPAHAVVVVKNVDTAKDVEVYMNKMFGADRDRFPLSKGYKAKAVWGSSSSKLDYMHPFFRYKRLGKLDTLCCRFLVVVDMATEGMNNKYANVMGLARSCRSVRQILQRVGRLIRSTHTKTERVDGTFEYVAPPANHDAVHILTHCDYGDQGEGNNNIATIQRAVHFMVDMPNAMQDMMDIEQYVGIDFEHEDEEDGGRVTLTYSELMTITDYIGAAKVDGRNFSTRRMMQALPSNKAAKKILYRNTAKRLYDGVTLTKETIRKTLLTDVLPEPMQDVAVDDKVHLVQLDVEQAKKFLEDNGIAAAVQLHEVGSATWLEAANQIHRAIDNRFRSTQFETSQTVMGAIDTLTSEICSLPGLHSKTVREAASGIVLEAVLSYLQKMGATGVSIMEGGKHDIPEIVQELRSESWRAEVKKFVINALLCQGHLKSLAAVLGEIAEVYDEE